jgi:hypothetical protein
LLQQTVGSQPQSFITLQNKGTKRVARIKSVLEKLCLLANVEEPRGAEDDVLLSPAQETRVYHAGSRRKQQMHASDHPTNHQASSAGQRIPIQKRYMIMVLQYERD